MSSISGNVTFYGNSTNDSTDPTAIVGVPLFLDNSSNQGVISSGIFSGSAFNAGEVQTTATFVGSAVNSGVVAIATFNDGAVNFGTITSSGLFYGTAVNSGIISGNAIFADTAANNGTVEGNADFAAGASNQGGTVNGTTGVYAPPGNDKNGAYSDGYFLNNSIDTNYSTSTPIQAVDDSKYYTYNNGISILFSAGAVEINGSWYSITDGVRENTAAFNGAAQVNSFYYTVINGSLTGLIQNIYANEVLMSANDGLYYNFNGNGYLPATFNGALNINGSWYSIVDGVRESTATFNGFYEQNASIYALIVNGTTTADSALGVLKNAADGLYYYLSGVNTLDGLADGATSAGVFAQGVITPYNGQSLAFDDNKYYEYSQGIPVGFPALGIVFDTNAPIFVTIENSQWQIGNRTLTSDGQGGASESDFEYLSVGTTITTGDVYVYKSLGDGTFSTNYKENYVLSSGNNPVLNISELNQDFDNGTYEELADGNGGSSFNYSYPTAGFEFYSNNIDYHWVANGSGGFNKYYLNGYVIQDDAANNIIIFAVSYPNGTFDEIADGNGGSTFNYTYAAIGTEFYLFDGISYQSDGNGGYTEVPV